MSAADKLVRQAESDDYPALQAVRDAQYLEDCASAGIDPAPNHPKQLSVNVVLPAVDRGRRVDGSPLVDEKAESDYDQGEGIDQATESSEQLDDETERAIKAAGEVLDRKLVRFLIQGRKAARIATRLAAIALLSRSIRPHDLYTVFDPREVTENRLRLARAELAELLGEEEKTACSVPPEQAAQIIANHHVVEVDDES